MLGALSDSEIQEFLSSATLGRLACRSGNEILVLPITFRYAAGCVYCHSFEGTKIRWMRATPQVGFETDEILDHRNWRSVAAQGLFEELTAAAEIDAAKAILEQSWKGDKSSFTALPPAESPESPRRTSGPSVFFRIRLSAVTGRFEQAII